MDHLVPAQATDAEKLGLAYRAIADHDFRAARCLLEEVTVNTPEKYEYLWEAGGEVFIRFWEAEEFFQYVISLKEDETAKPVQWVPNLYTRACYSLAYLDMEEGKPEDALIRLDFALKLEPDQPLLFCEMALACSSLGQHDKALSLYEQALQSRSYITAPVMAKALRGMGVELVELGELDGAKDCLIHSLRCDPKSEMALKELAYISMIKTGMVETLEPMGPLRQVKPASERCASCGKEILEGSQDFKIANAKGRLAYFCGTCGMKEGYHNVTIVRTSSSRDSFMLATQRLLQNKYREAIGAVRRVISSRFQLPWASSE